MVFECFELFENPDLNRLRQIVEFLFGKFREDKSVHAQMDKSLAPERDDF